MFDINLLTYFQICYCKDNIDILEDPWFALAENCRLDSVFVQAIWLHLGLLYVLGERRLEDSVSGQEGNPVVAESNPEVDC